MMTVYETYEVTFNAAVTEPSAHEHAVTLRVSEPDLKSFLAVLTFNGVQRFEVVKEQCRG